MGTVRCRAERKRARNTDDGTHPFVRLEPSGPAAKGARGNTAAPTGLPNCALPVVA